MKVSPMKTNHLGPLLAGLAVLQFTATQIHAADISGAISFSGGATLGGPLATANAFTSFEGIGSAAGPVVLGGSMTGDYSSVTAGTSATFDTFTFNPSPSSATPLWSFTDGGLTYSFSITSVTVDEQTPFFLNLSGDGVASITGFSDTPATWSITDTGNGATPIVTFGNANLVAPVKTTPEPTTAGLMLVGLGSFGFARLFRRSIRCGRA
jgi:hypothetical protein